MSITEYHSNLSAWMRNSVTDVVNDIDKSLLWKRYDHINSPGWTLMHLIVEGEYALSKLDTNYKPKITNAQDFMFGSDGSAKADLTLDEMINTFNHIYISLDGEVSKQLSSLKETPVKDAILKDILNTELDFYLHMLTTHLAMHCDALVKWRLTSGLKLSWED